jgi:hypothetical protein
MGIQSGKPQTADLSWQDIRNPMMGMYREIMVVSDFWVVKSDSAGTM